jgi:hypothetical protein
VPVRRLLVEGKLDREILTPLFAGNPLVDPRPTSKGSLAPRARDLRLDHGQTACYIRDRDFDFLPPGDLTQPTVDKSTDAGATLGWRWCRHEIENYLIDPGIIHATFGWDRATFETQLVDAARRIKHYQVSRWAIGQARQVLPPAKKFPSKPTECARHEFRLPADLTSAGTATWAQTQAATFLADVQTTLPAALSTAMTAHSARFTDAFLGDVANVLVWCSGKDLLASLMPWLKARHRLHPSQLRTRVRDWIELNPDPTLVLLPEWDSLRNLLRAYP